MQGSQSNNEAGLAMVEVTTVVKCQMQPVHAAGIVSGWMRDTRESCSGLCFHIATRANVACALHQWICMTTAADHRVSHDVGCRLETGKKVSALSWSRSGLCVPSGHGVEGCECRVVEYSVESTWKQGRMITTIVRTRSAESKSGTLG